MTVWVEQLSAIDEWVNEGVVRGAGAAIWRDGEIVATHEAGEAAPGRPVTSDTLFALASVSKPITTAAIMAAVERGDLTLDTPVVAVLPEFGEVDDLFDDDVVPQLEALRDRITLRQLLSHTSGLPENVGVKRIRMSDLPTTAEIVDAMCTVPLQSPPGQDLRYSNVGIGVAGRMLERATGDEIHDLIQRDVLDPMNFGGIVTRPGNTLADRIAIVQDASAEGTPAESYNSLWWRTNGITWGGYFGTASDIVRFATTFLPDEPSPLSQESRAKMVMDQTGRAPGGVMSAGIVWKPGAWGLGWEVAANKRNHWTGSLRSPETYCHWGQAGTLVWVDPKRRLALAVFANRSVRTPWPLKPARWHALSDAVVRASDALA